ncbi:MAG: transcription-repair coupling factor [Bacteroidetes bacterium HGW-Bacteroidetes-21]|nr:MAG: transcription-repair coupling factor [Bacteroidetes bacterium HGW-Bacteroidetes-21]
MHLKGLAGSSQSLLVSALFSKTKTPIVCLFKDKESAAYFHNDLSGLFGADKIMFFPSSFRKKLTNYEADNHQLVQRTEVISGLKTDKSPTILITYIEAFAEKVISPLQMEEQSICIRKGEKISSAFLEEVLFEYQFEYTDFVTVPGQFSRRGSIVDIFSFSNEKPVRIDFFGDEVESIRFFDIESQLSISTLESIVITPDFQITCPQFIETSLMSFYPEETIIFMVDSETSGHNLNNFSDEPRIRRKIYGETTEDHLPIFFSWDDCIKTIEQFSILDFSQIPLFTCKQIIEFNTSSQPLFNKKFDLLASELAEKKEKGYKVFLLAENQVQASRLNSIFEDLGFQQLFTHLPIALHEGFIDHDTLTAIYCDHQIFERYHRYKIRSDFAKKEAITLHEFLSLNPGDYIVHIDHGIGVFAGLEKSEINGKLIEQIKLVYKDNDVLYVSLHNLHKISKYKSGEATSPKLNKLGTGAWQQLKSRTKSRIKDIARDLINLYALRLEQKGFAFQPDSYMQNELEASFIYEDTADQVKATTDIKRDMESDIPMDRLICGDVGFGKTELAVRAAFKAVADNKQVAILVPTTILALQHFYTFSDRLRNFPCSIDHVSRLRSASEQKAAIKKLEEGKTDIIIGTHKILGKEIRFKDLGLLVIDEEQKFGVAAKEKLRTLRVNVDTLTLTATPIPRTLQFSLMGARDLSILNTPPPNRQPMVTEIHTFNEEVIKAAVDKEIERGGQVFFVHNRVQNIAKIKIMLLKLCPYARIIIGHGQMKPGELEETMLSFIDGSYDILIATTIIENGLDIPNANTIIINDAQNYGLSDLHQLRGRVGRSNKKAFCYLLTPNPAMLSDDARRRLKAIETFSELGSGFNIAMQDLDIRGAGNLLGGEQSGYIADIGFETYRKILNEAISELKESDFKGRLMEPESKNKVPELVKATECSIETDLELFIPEDYVESMTERLKLYREISGIEDEAQIEKIKTELTDVYGKIPIETLKLLNVGILRKYAIQAGFERLILKNRKMIAYFIGDMESSYYSTNAYKRILEWLMQNKMGAGLKESKSKLSLTIDKVPSIERASKIMLDIYNYVFEINTAEEPTAS